MKVGTTDPLVVDAVMFRLDIYGAGMHCDGAGVRAGSGTPLMSHTYERGEPIALDVPPGPHALVLTTFSDPQGQDVLGRGCTVQTLSAGAQVCFDLTLAAVGDLASGAGDGGVDMAKGGGSCGTCSPADSCCQSQCTDVATAVDNCGGCGMSCSSDHIARHCAAGGCDGACFSGYADCNSDKRSDGCETPIDTIANCGACGATCDTSHSFGATCTGSACTYTSCQPGFLDCNKTAPDNKGCSCATATMPTFQGAPGCCGSGCQTQHDNGVGQSFYDCSASGTHDATEAMAACIAKTGDKNSCYVFSCSMSASVVCDSSCKSGCSACNCWEYGFNDSGVGHVNTNCFCASGSDSMWN